MQYFNFSFHFIFFKLKYRIWTTFKMQILSVFKFLFIYLLEKKKLFTNYQKLEVI